jgi:hypothetical protein
LPANTSPIWAVSSLNSISISLLIIIR